MIDYTEKGSGLHQAIRQAGHSLHQENGEWIASDDAAVQAIIDGYTIAQAQALKQSEISAHAKALRDKAVGNISAGEMASWPIKLAEARAFAADPASPTPMLSAEAAIRGITVADIVGKVDNNATGFAALEAQIGGVDGMHRDAVRALTTFEAVNGYDFSGGWPAL